MKPGTWKPNAKEFGEFARAVARRYSGTFNPGDGVLPRVVYFQGWGEPNLDNHLTPQWSRVGGRWVDAAAPIYRGLLNAFYSAVKSVHRNDVVLTGGTGPFGDVPGGHRVPPARFWRDVFCLRGRSLARSRCPNPAHFDVLAHHPYEFGGPTQRAFNPDDVTLPDFGKLTNALHVAARHGLVLPHGPKRVWVTEFSWDSRPPDPKGVPVMTRAYWTEEAFYELWREGVSALAWYLIRDQPPIPDYGYTYQSGLYYFNGRLKPGLEGFRFPFVVQAGRLWGISPVAGQVQVQQQQQGGGWRTRYRFQVAAHEIFARPLSLRRGQRLRAVIGSERSLVWPR